MKFWISLVNVPEVEQYIEIAQCAESLGFYGITIADHLIWPTNIESKYPYLESGDVWWPENMPWPDPWITLATVGAATNTLKLATNIYLAALRDPITVAKSVSTTACFNPDRVIAGFSSGWIKEEYDFLNIDFKSRGRRLDETIEVSKKLWSGKSISHQGEFFQYENAVMHPVPSSAPPVWVGGHSDAALKRAARNDGWLGLPGTVNELIQTADKINRYRNVFDRSHQPFEMSFNLTEEPTAEKFEILERSGLSNMMVLPWQPSPWSGKSFACDGEDPTLISTKKKAMQIFSEEVMSLS